MAFENSSLLYSRVLVSTFVLMILAARAVGEGSNPRSPLGIQEVGGSNYVMFRVGESYRVENESGSWNRPGVLHPVIGTFHLQDRQLVLDQLTAMHRHGQRKIGFMLWYDQLPFYYPESGVFGHVVPANGGTLLPQHQENLRKLLTMIRQTGFFDEVVFRFAVQGKLNPTYWKTWDEALYQENWNFLITTRQIVQEALMGSDIKLCYDLGAELGGLDSGEVPAYTKRLWMDYCHKFGLKDSYGFSIATHPGRLARMVQMFKETEAVPDVFALDLYFNIYELLHTADVELKAEGIDRSRIIVQEVAYNDSQTLQEIQRAQQDYDLEIRYIMQWPIEIEKHYWPNSQQPRHFSVDYPVRYDAYLRQ